ncbi:type VI secretion system ImpA family N-terminal domain-containing protein [Photobacterium indicum]|uniref:type VI secretion system ImpA family N-terminal domain-containing protein n=1 Tax=Photobacterium indicum TaxID=81447 RepID=UPI003D110985
MSKLYFSDMSQFRLVSDETQLRESATYQQIRSEINRRFNPLAGGVDWERVRSLCEHIGETEGVDLLVAIYYAVSAVKTQGLVGLANGLELQAAVNSQFAQSSIFPAARRAELYSWMIARVTPEIRALKPNINQLRDLYRCERACQSLHDMLLKSQPGHVPDLEAIGFIIFEHIDLLEIKAGSRQLATEYKVANEPTSKRRFRIMNFFIGATLAAMVMISFSQFGMEAPTPITALMIKHRVPKIVSFEEGKTLKSIFGSDTFEVDKTDLVNLYTKAVQSLIDEPIGHNFTQAFALSKSIQRLYPDDLKVSASREKLARWQQDTLQEIDKQYRRFATARTRAANIHRLSEKGDIITVRALSKDLELYAISLSPLYGRAMYVEELMKDGSLDQAQSELNTLRNSIKGLSFKSSQLEQSLKLMLQHPK